MHGFEIDAKFVVEQRHAIELLTRRIAELETLERTYLPGWREWKQVMRNLEVLRDQLEEETRILHTVIEVMSPRARRSTFRLLTTEPTAPP